MRAAEPATAPFGRMGGGSVALALLTAVLCLLSLALPVATLQFYDRILPNRSFGTMSVLVVGVIMAITLETALKLCRTYMTGYAGAAFVHRISSSAVDHVLAADLTRLKDGDRPVDFSNLSVIRNLKEFHNGGLIITLVELAFIPAFLCLIAYIGGVLVLAPIGLLATFICLTVFFGSKLKAALCVREANDDLRYDFLIDAMRCVHSIKAFAQENIMLRRYERLQRGSSSSNLAVSGAMMGALNGGAVFAQALTATTIGVGAIMVINGGLSQGALIAVVLIAGRIMQPVQKGVVLWARLQDYKVSRAKAARIFETPLLNTDIADEPPERIGRIDIVDFSFGFDPNGPALLRDINLQVELGESVSIAGAQGSGKSVLLKMIAGLHKPTNGEILIDGLAPTRFPRHTLKGHVGYLPASGEVLRGTIRDNITRFGEAPLTDAMFVAGLIGVDREFAQLPAGVDTKIESAYADSIPPGLQQRIAIVRALATKPRVIVVDNADRALDMDGYRAFHALLARLRSKAAMIIVSDDENLRRLADRHYELDSGRLVEVAIDSQGNSTPRKLRL